MCTGLQEDPPDLCCLWCPWVQGSPSGLHLQVYQVFLCLHGHLCPLCMGGLVTIRLLLDKGLATTRRGVHPLMLTPHLFFFVKQDRHNSTFEDGHVDVGADLWDVTELCWGRLKCAALQQLQVITALPAWSQRATGGRHQAHQRREGQEEDESQHSCACTNKTESRPFGTSSAW